MVKTSKFGTEDESVIIQTGNFIVTILPRLGGKIASIRRNGQELLQLPMAAYAPRTRTMPFDAGDASGWDECLPSVAPCTVETAAGLVTVPDHGDLWRVAWTVEQGTGNREQGTAAANENVIILRGECFSLPLRLERKVALAQYETGWRLSLDYTVTNTGSAPVPWAWGAHPLFTSEAGDRLVLPPSISTLTLEGSAGGRLGQTGDQVLWPIAKLARGGETDLSLAKWPESGIGDKLFAGRLTASENWCALERPQAGVRIRVSFDSVATPYLGLWICFGGWPEKPGPKQVCVAMEPATAPVDSLAITGPWSRTLAPGDSFSWPMVVDFENF
jgi:galactose mutarotase-like enzyme